LHGCEVEWVKQPDGWKIKELKGTEFVQEVGLVLLALGFLHVAHEGLVQDLGLQLDAKGNVIADDYQTSEPWVFAAGDTISGASLVVRAIDSGRLAAAAMDRWLCQGV
jgi:NADPH-dependent glutamate synthase beta subunit-like oxidoreductase